MREKKSAELKTDSTVSIGADRAPLYNSRPWSSIERKSFERAKMERDFQYETFLQLNNSNNMAVGECSSSSSDEMAAFNSLFSSVSLLSLLTATPLPPVHQPLLPPLPLLADFANSVNLPPPPPSFAFFSDADTGTPPSSFANFFRLPKPEPLPFCDATDETNPLSHIFLPPPPPPPPPPPTPMLIPFNFMFTADSSSATTESQPFHHLPDLLSLDHFSPSSAAAAAAEDYSASSSSSLGPLRKRQRANSASQHLPPSSPPPPMVPRSSALARQRRQRLSDKTRCLQKLLPWDKKMDTATMLEEAYKYVKFLQAQLAALRSMPALASLSSSPNTASGGGRFGGLGRLNRNQLLQVLVNSPVSQTTLYSKGCCVFSVEQLGLLARLADMSRSTGTAATPARNISSLPSNRF